MKSLSFSDFFVPFSSGILQELERIRRLLEGEYSARIFVVGGAVRDRLLGRSVVDLDLEIYGLDPGTFAEAMERLGAKGVGKSFYVYKYGAIDIALPRRERKTGIGHRGFSVEPATDPREASRRRDFTINALMYELQSARILDHWGGLEDLESRRLRCVDPESFVEDSLRVLRAMRFAVQLGFRVEEATCRLCREIPLDDLPGARIFGEFERMFLSPFLARGLHALFVLGIARRLWGEREEERIFVPAARDLIRYAPDVPETLRPYFFTAVYRQYSRVPMERVLEAIDAPNRYRRMLEALPEIPERIFPSFVAGLAEKEGVAASALGYHPMIRRLAEKLGVWEEPFGIGVTPAELMERGFAGKALGEELRRIRGKKLAELDRKEME
jgi:tRNA nucleotidyltransferase (CCA-adding enzyme)